MNWLELNTLSQLDEIKTSTRPILIFKHSTRCSISVMAKGRLERAWQADPEVLTPYYLDLLAHRDISNQIATLFHVAHESPQVLLIAGGECLYTASHQDIQYDEIMEQASKTA